MTLASQLAMCKVNTIRRHFAPDRLMRNARLSSGICIFPQLLAGDAPLEGLFDLLMQLLARFAYDFIKWVVNKLCEWWRQKT